MTSLARARRPRFSFWFPDWEDEKKARVYAHKNPAYAVLRLVTEQVEHIGLEQDDRPLRVLARSEAGRAKAFDVSRDGARLIVAAVPCCRVCGCTDDRACAGGCRWAQDDLCTACVEKPS